MGTYTPRDVAGARGCYTLPARRPVIPGCGRCLVRQMDHKRFLLAGRGKAVSVMLIFLIRMIVPAATRPALALPVPEV